MRKTRDEKKVNIRKAKIELRKVDKLFADLEKDKTLPSFVQHVAICMVLGTSEKVNLKAMYPYVHRKLSILLKKNIAKV